MSVDYEHPDYKKMMPIWKRCRDAACGKDAVKPYIIRLVGQSDTDYKAYQERASYFNATWRTIAAMNGMLFRKPPIVDVQASITPLLEDVTLAGCPFEIFAQEISEESLTVGRVGLLVDYPSANTEGMSAADAAQLNLRPVMQMYKAESIINWKMGRVNNKYVLIQLVLRECYYKDKDKDEFEQEEETQYRVLDLINGFYRQRLFKKEGKKDVQISGDIFPMMNNKEMGYIPFIFLSTDDLSSDVHEPVIIDLVDLNLSHFRVSAHYEHGCHWSGLAQAWIAGHTMESGQSALTFGGGGAWVFPNEGAKAEMLSLNHNFTALRDNLDAKKQEMAILGARMLTADKKGIESADTANIHRAGETSILSKTAQTLSEGLTRALRIFSDWAGVDGLATCELNREFTATVMTPQDAVAFMQLVQGGAMSQESAFNNMKRGGLYEDADTFEVEQARIGDATPTEPSIS